MERWYHSYVGFDSGKLVKGRKRHLLVDTLGLVLMVVVTSAYESDQAGAKKLFAQAKRRISDRLNRLVCIWVVAGYQGQGFIPWVMDTYRWILEVVRRPTDAKGFVLLPKRWVVERSFGWFNWCRRLSKDYEILPQTHETFVQIAMIRLMRKKTRLIDSFNTFQTSSQDGVDDCPESWVQSRLKALSGLVRSVLVAVAL